MCGIIGYVGSRTDAGELVIEGLKHLEYRGYDSWGVACSIGDGFLVKKDIGKISAVNGLEFYDQCSLAVAHTRWATHGGVTKLNAHPHLSCDQTIAVIHNGIIENFTELRKELLAKGHRFQSETDTEVIPHLIEEELKKDPDFAAAVRRACLKFHGRFAILALHTASHTLVAARTGSPLIVGVGEDGYFVASDFPAFVKYTKTVQYLDDGEMVVTDGENILFTDLLTGAEKIKREIEITWSIEQAEKGDFEHYMLKEIMDQKESVARAVNQDEEKIKAQLRPSRTRAAHSSSGAARRPRPAWRRSTSSRSLPRNT